MSTYSECQRVAEKGLAAGSAIWSAIDAANDAGLIKGRDMVSRFEIMLEDLCDGCGAAERPLFEASAMRAIAPAVDGVLRTIISRTADNAWRNYEEALRADAQADADDFRFQQMRDERVPA